MACTIFLFNIEGAEDTVAAVGPEAAGDRQSREVWRLNGRRNAAVTDTVELMGGAVGIGIGDGADEACTPVLFVRHASQEMIDPFRITGIGSGTPSPRLYAEFSGQRFNVDAGIVGNAGQAGLREEEAGFDRCILGEGRSDFLGGADAADVGWREERCRQAAQCLAHFDDFAGVGGGEKKMHPE